MWTYNKVLQYPINIKCPNPRLAKYIISQYGGPDGGGSAGTGEIVSGGRTDDGRSGDSLPPSGADAGGNEGNSDCKTPQH